MFLNGIKFNFEIIECRQKEGSRTEGNVRVDVQLNHAFYDLQTGHDLIHEV